MYSIFANGDIDIAIHAIEDMSVYDWTERMMKEILMNFTLFVVNYLISGVGIIMTIMGLAREIKYKKEIVQ